MQNKTQLEVTSKFCVCVRVCVLYIVFVSCKRYVKAKNTDIQTDLRFLLAVIAVCR